MPGYVALVAAVDALGGGLLAIKLHRRAPRAALSDGRGLRHRRRALFGRARGARRRSRLRAVARRHRRLQRHGHRHARGRSAGRRRLGAGARRPRAHPLARRRPLRAGAGARRLRAGGGAAAGGARGALLEGGARRWRQVVARTAAGRAGRLPRAPALGPAQPTSATASSSSPTATAATPRSWAPTRTPTACTAARSTACSPKARRTRCSRRRTASRIAPPTSSPSSWTRLEPAYARRPARRQGRPPAHARAAAALLAALPRRACSPRAAPSLRFFSRHRTGVERLVDGFWFALVAATLIGLVVAVSPAQLDGALAPAPAAGAGRALHAVLRRGPLPPGHRGAPAAVRRGGDDLAASSCRGTGVRRRGLRAEAAFSALAVGDRVPGLAAPARGRRTVCATATGSRCASAPSTG